MKRAYLLALIAVAFSQKVISAEPAHHQYFKEQNNQYEDKIKTENREIVEYYHESKKIDLSEFDDYSILVPVENFTNLSPNGK